MIKQIFILILCIALLSACASTQPENKSPPPTVPTPGIAEASSTVSPEVIVLEGRIDEVKVNAGTLSEYGYYVIVTDAMSQTIFNEKGFSVGFDEWKNQQVTITCRNSTGKIGFRGEIVPGVTVLTIKPR